MQDKSNLGTRYTCFECGKKFYDLNKPQPACPGCGTNQLEDPTPDPRVAVMAKYKGSRMTAKEAEPSKEAIAIEPIDDSTEEVDSIEAGTAGDVPAEEDDLGEPPAGLKEDAADSEKANPEPA